VSDTGEGISPETLPHVFDRFRQGEAESHRLHGGLGLGLAIVKQLTSLHGGHVSAASDGPGRGATFTVRIPAKASVDSENLVPQVVGEERWRGESEPLATDTLRGIEVWVVDDEPAILEYMCNLLSAHGAQVQSFGSGGAALAELRRMRAKPSTPVVLLTDLVMGDMDGVSLVRAIRTDLNLGAECVSALAVTSFARDEDRQRASAAGFQGYLKKPYETAHLLACVRKLAQGERETNEVDPH